MSQTALQTIHVLLVEGSSIRETDFGGDPFDLRELIQSPGEFTIDSSEIALDVTFCRDLHEVLEYVQGYKVDVLLLPILDEEDEHFISMLQRLHVVRVPAVIGVVSNNDEDLIHRAIDNGAQDCVTFQSLTVESLFRIVRHAMTRQTTRNDLYSRARELEVARAKIQQQADQLSRDAKKLDRINHNLDEFAYIVSHDLKEPLRGIAAYCDILYEDYAELLDEDGVRRLATLGDLCRQLERLVAAVLECCRIGGKLPVEGEVNLDLSVQMAIASLKAAIERSKGEVLIDRMLGKGRGDETLITQIFANLIGNGLKFNNSKHPRVEVGRIDKKPCVYYVKDNGIGIDKKHHDEVFTIFRRLHSKKKYEGTGAGLTIVKKIVQAHGGRIWLESKKGKGSTFYFTLEKEK